jgi:hypothetical protein
MIDNNASMQYNNQMIISQSMGSRPVNTTKAYSRKQDKWKAIFQLAITQYKHP